MMDFVTVDSEDRPLLYSWAWLFALGELLVGGQARALATSHDWSLGATAYDDTNQTTVLGIGVQGAAPARSGGAPLYVLVSAFNGGVYNSTAAEEMGVGVKSVQLDVALADVGGLSTDDLATLCAVHSAHAAGGDDGDDGVTVSLSKLPDGMLRVEQYYMDSDNAVYDTLWRDLNANGWLAEDDDYVYDVSTMASDDGKAYIEETATFSAYDAMQRDLLTPRSFAGVAEFDKTRLKFEFEMAVPSVMMLVITAGNVTAPGGETAPPGGARFHHQNGGGGGGGGAGDVGNDDGEVHHSS